jgi:hypothetical protein
MRGSRIEPICVSRVDVRVIHEPALCWVICDVSKLTTVILRARDAMRMIARLPYLTGSLFAPGEGKAAFDQLNGSLDCVPGRKQYMDMFWHDDESMQQKPGLIAIAVQRCDQEFSVRGDLEQSEALMSNGSNRVGLGAHEDSISLGLKPVR